MFSQRPPYFRYGFAVVAALAAIAVRVALNPLLGEGLIPFLGLYLAIVFVAWYAGPGPAAVTLAIGAAGAHFVLLPDAVRLPLWTRETDAALLLYLMAATLCLVLGHLLSRATHKADQHARIARERQRQLELLSNTIPALVSYIDRDCRYVTCNQAYATWFRKSQEELVGRTVREVVGEDVWQVIGPRVARALAGETVEFESEVRYQRGERWIHAVYTPHLDDTGRVEGIVALVTDVTGSKRADVALRASEERFRAFMDNSPARAWLKDAEGRYLFANESLARALGHSPEELIGHTDADFFSPAEAEQYRRNDLAVLQNGGVTQLTETVRQPDGEHHYLVVKFPITGDAGRYVGGIAVDVTGQKRAEDALREADRRKDEFLAILAHELRNPLAPIRTGLDLLRLDGHRPQTLRQVREIMERQVAHMVRLLDDLLDVSRITTGRIQLKKQPTSLDALVQGAVEANRAAIDAAGLQLGVDLPKTPPWLDVDPTRFIQVLSNLLNNATKFTPRGGRIDVAARVEPATGGSGTDTVVLTVRDTGVGIDAATIPRLFDFFVQGNHESQGSAGLGIGLALSRRLVELHGGTIEVASDGPGQGSAFTLRMPALARDAVPGPVPQPADDAPRAAHRVLVVDDNADAADTLASLARQFGADVRVAYDGTTALQLAAELRPDVVLLDLGMPAMDGYDVCRRLRDEPYGRAMSIVALTGWGQEEDVQRTLQGGFDAHVTKPADALVLRTLLAKPVRRHDRNASEPSAAVS